MAWVFHVEQYTKYIWLLNLNLGAYTDIKEAAEAYNKKAKELYGEFAETQQ